MLKKQYIIAAAILLVAIALIVVYFAFLREEAPVEETEDFYILSDISAEKLNSLDDNVRIVLLREESYFNSDTYRKTVLDFLRLYAADGGRVTLEFASADDWPDAADENTVVFAGKSATVYVDYNDIFKKLEDGTFYAFDGERLFTDALLVADGKQATAEGEIALKALDGYDTDGDTVGTSGRAFLYPNISRSDVQSIKIKNEYGNYEAYRKDNNFYFRDAELCEFDAEKFASFIVNCTYMLSVDKIRDPMDLSVYGLDSEENAKAVIEVLTVDGDYHKILVGNKTAAGTGYYAKYIGKDFVYVIDTAIENDVLQPLANMLKANLVYGITQQGDLYGVDNILIKKYNYEEGGHDTDIIALLLTKIESSSNISLYNSEQTVGGILLNKKYYDTSAATSAWKSNEALLGFSKKSGNDVYFDLELENYAPDGKYSVKFGLVYDSAAGAVLPDGVSLEIHTGDGFEAIDAGIDSFDQTDGSYRQYEISFESDEAVKWIRVRFAFGDGYIVLDELTPYASGADAIPEETITSIWKLLSPEEYIPAGKNFTYPSSSSFGEIVYSMTTLVGDRVVDYNLSVEMLEEYGLDKPATGISYSFNGYTVYVWFSEKNENGNYYCYSSIRGKDENGKDITMSTDIIAEVSPETAPWLEYDPLLFMDSGVFSMYIDRISEIKFTYGGNDYVFTLGKNENGELNAVSCNGTPVDLQNFRYLYISILNLKLEGEYSDTDSTPVETMRMEITNTDRTDEIVFYQVSSAKAYYTKNGEGRYYILVDGMRTIQKNIQLLLAGQAVPH